MCLMSNQECKIRPEITNINSNKPSLYPYSVKKTKAVVDVTTIMIHMQNCKFLMLLKI